MVCAIGAQQDGVSRDTQAVLSRCICEAAHSAVQRTATPPVVVDCFHAVDIRLALCHQGLTALEARPESIDRVVNIASTGLPATHTCVCVTFVPATQTALRATVFRAAFHRVVLWHGAGSLRLLLVGLAGRNNRLWALFANESTVLLAAPTTSIAGASQWVACSQVLATLLSIVKARGFALLSGGVCNRVLSDAHAVTSLQTGEAEIRPVSA